VIAPRKDSAPARAETAKMPNRPWDELEAALATRDEAATALEAFLGGRIDERELHRLLEAAAASGTRT
jgi:hypothetical protein